MSSRPTLNRTIGPPRAKRVRVAVQAALSHRRSLTWSGSTGARPGRENVTTPCSDSIDRSASRDVKCRSCAKRAILRANPESESGDLLNGAQPLRGLLPINALTSSGVSCWSISVFGHITQDATPRRLARWGSRYVRLEMRRKQEPTVNARMGARGVRSPHLRGDVPQLARLARRAYGRFLLRPARSQGRL
jgi:hypothetical protein